jgi:hypothetical protein
MASLVDDPEQPKSGRRIRRAKVMAIACMRFEPKHRIDMNGSVLNQAVL